MQGCPELICKLGAAEGTIINIGQITQRQVS